MTGSKLRFESVSDLRATGALAKGQLSTSSTTLFISAHAQNPSDTPHTSPATASSLYLALVKDSAPAIESMNLAYQAGKLMPEGQRKL